MSFACPLAQSRSRECDMTARPQVAVGLFTLALALPVSAARADPFLITAGTMTAKNVGGSHILGTVDLRGTEGFEAHLVVDASYSPWACRPCGPAGASQEITTVFSGSNGRGTVQVNGVSYSVPSRAAIQLPASGDPVILPPISAGASLSAPFELIFSFVSLYDVGDEPVVTLPIEGRGIVTIELIPNPFQPLWEFSRATYDFSPVPEPTSLMLLGTGVLAMVAKRTRRRPTRL
jgi:hypothetical protein